ncbi:MAG TPA: hypothetical protein VHE30_22955 [Polyangiaceae bacterium]|nr:hypothetical protein [Polyangiaceae bacterium]
MEDESRARARLALYLTPLALATIAGTIGVMFMPWFLTNRPLTLIALSPLFRHFVLVSPSVAAAPLFAIGVPRHFAVDPFVYLLGRDYGPAAVMWVETNSPGLGRLVRALERLFAKVGPLALLVSPDIVVSTLAGAARVSFPVFVVMNLLGTVANIVVARLFGTVLEAEITAFTTWIRAHVVVATAISVALFLAFNAWSKRKGDDTGREATGE